MQRFDNRSQAVIAEVNAIGTAQLRTQLLPIELQPQVTDLLDRYVALRIEISQVDLTQQSQRRQYMAKITDLQQQLWQQAVTAANIDPRPVTTGAFINALNELIDSQGKRSALQNMHVPEIVLLLLFFAFISSGAILGYSGGLSGKRVTIPAGLVSLLITLIVFIIIDLDRPKRGMIQVDQSTMLELQSSSANTIKAAE